MAAAESETGFYAPTLDTLETLGIEALATIPEELRRHIGNVVIQVAEFPDDDTIDAMNLESPFDILGLYRGVTLKHRDSGGPPSLDMIFLYRRPILDYWCETGEDLAVLVRHVLVHEIGHHFGFSDDDMERIEGED